MFRVKSFNGFISIVLTLHYVSLLVSLEANVLENIAATDVTCDESAMYLQMNFTRPFQGIVYTPNNYFNPSCSYAASPTSTSEQIKLTLSLTACGTEVNEASGMMIAFNTIRISNHRMLDTTYDYAQNVSCELSNFLNTPEISILRNSTPKLSSWIALEAGSTLFPGAVDDIGDDLLLSYHVQSGGVYQDMIVMNCIGHDEIIINELTKLYQISNPYGCVSDSDLVSNFSIIKDTGNETDLVAYAIFKNSSMVSRGKFYITCGAQLCNDKCESRCEEINQLLDPLYFTDMATKGMVNRAPDSQIPLSLSIFDRLDRLRRSHSENASNSKKQNMETGEKVPSSVFSLNFFKNFNLSENTTGLPGDTVILQTSAFKKTNRYRRAVKVQGSKDLSNVNDQSIESEISDVKTYNRNINITFSNVTGLTNTSVVTTNPPVIENYFKTAITAPKMGFSRFNRSISKNGFSVLSCTLRTIITIFALLCLCGACFSLYIVKRQPRH